MRSFEVTGGARLQGAIIPQGAKNEALQILCAVLLTPEEVVVHNVPDIVDVRQMISLLDELGVDVQPLGTGSWTFRAATIRLERMTEVAFHEKANRLRGSVMIAGPLLARFGKSFIPRPGGDKIGRRKMDTHVLGLEKLGVKAEYDAGMGCFHLSAGKLSGNYILLDEPSVTGTANIVIAAVMAEGHTTIYNAACEPYLQQLCRMLNKMGSSIKGIGSNLL